MVQRLQADDGELRAWIPECSDERDESEDELRWSSVAEYCQVMSHPSSYAGHVEVQVVSACIQRPIAWVVARQGSTAGGESVRKKARTSVSAHYLHDNGVFGMEHLVCNEGNAQCNNVVYVVRAHVDAAHFDLLVSPFYENYCR